MSTAINQEVRRPLFYRRPFRLRVPRRPEAIAATDRTLDRDNPVLVESVPNTGARQRCLQNLRPWRKGQSGNPAGRPKDTLLFQERRKFLAGPLSAEEYDRLVTVIAKKVFERAVSGDVRASVEIRNRIEGRARRIVTVN